MANSLWVRLHILWKSVSLHLFIWPIECLWHCTFYEWHSHDMVPSDQQVVSEIAHFVKDSLITTFLMTIRMWVTMHILWRAVQFYHIFLYEQQGVSEIAHFMKINSWHLFLWPTGSESDCTFCGSLVTSFPMINSLWARLHIFWKAVSSHLSYNQQLVSHTWDVLLYLIQVGSLNFSPCLEKTSKGTLQSRFLYLLLFG